MPFLLKDSAVEHWLSTTDFDFNKISLLPENHIDAHLIEKRIINSQNPNRKEVQEFYKEDFIQGSLF